MLGTSTNYKEKTYQQFVHLAWMSIRHWKHGMLTLKVTAVQGRLHHINLGTNAPPQK